MGIIIIVLVGVLISTVTNKNKSKQTATETALVREDENKPSEPTKVEENSKDAEKAEDTKLEPVANVTPSSETKNEDLPKTGAGSVLGLALLAGSATTYVFSKRKN